MVRSKVNLKLIGDEKRRRNTFIKRRSGLENKARELSILCDIPVLLLCLGPQGQDELIWPADRTEAYAIAARFRSASAEHHRLKRTYDVSTFFGDAVMGQAVDDQEGAEEEGRDPADQRRPSKERLLSLMPDSSLQELEETLEARLREIEERMGVLLRRRRGGDGAFQLMRGGEQEDGHAAEWWHHQDGLALAQQHYDHLTWSSNPPPGDHDQDQILLRGCMDNGRRQYWGNPTGGGFDHVDSAAFGSGLKYYQNLQVQQQPLLNGAEAAAPPPPAYYTSSTASFELAPPSLQTTYGHADDDQSVMGTMVTYMGSSSTMNPHLSPGASVNIGRYPSHIPADDHRGYSELSYLNSCFNTFHSAPASTAPTAFLPPRSTSGAALSDYCGGGAMEQAASSSYNNGVHCLQGEPYGDGVGFLRDEPIGEGLEDQKPGEWDSSFYPDHLSGAIASTPLAADGRWAGFSGS